MAEESANSPVTVAPAPAPPAAPEAMDPYDLGNTEMDLSREQKPELPRGPDGKFLPRNPAPDPTVTPPPPVVEPAKPTHPEYLVRQAEDLGLPEAEIASMPTDVLGNTIWRMNRQRESFRQEQLKARTLSDSQVKPPQPEPPSEDIDLGLGEEAAMLNPKLIEAIQRVGRASAKEIKELKEKLAAQEQREVQRQNDQASNILDAAFAKLGEPFEKLFGKGPARGLGEAGKPQYMRRIYALQAAGITNLSQVDRATIVGKLKAAVEAMYPPEVAPTGAYGELSKPAPAPAPAPAVAATNGRISQEQWNDAGLAKPTHRADAPEPPGDSRAIHNLERRMREAGLTEQDSDIMDGLLPG